MTLFTIQGFISFIILTLFELVLGVDNLLFLSLIIATLPKEKRVKAASRGLFLAFLMRTILLLCILWLSHIPDTVFTLFNFHASVRDIVFYFGGIYLIWTAYKTLPQFITRKKGERKQANMKKIPLNPILQIAIIDMLFSFDSLFTAIGFIQNAVIIIAAIGTAMLFMFVLSGITSSIIARNPVIKVIVLCFMLVVGVIMIARAFHYQIHL